MITASARKISDLSARSLYRGVFLVALGTLLFEIALTRILSFTIWYHFAYVAISTALLGYGASGTLLAVWPSIGSKCLATSLARSTLLASVSTAAVLGVISLFPFDPMQTPFRARDATLFVVYQMAVTIPFFFSGLTISLALRAAAERVDRLYFWDLVGAGLGAAVAVPLMNALSPPGAAVLAGAAFAVAAVVFDAGTRLRAIGLALATLLSAGSLLGSHLPFTPAESKGIAFHLNQLNMSPVFTRWTALFRTDVVATSMEGPRLTNALEWGLSSKAPETIQRSWGFVHHDGAAGTSLYDLRAGRLDYLDMHILRMPYLVAPATPRVLVIGVGGGRDIVTAVRYGASHVTGVELDPVTIDLIRGDPFDISQGFFRQPSVTLVAGEGRHFVHATKERFDLIQLTGVDTLSAQSSGAYVLAENFLYTTEAFQDYLDHLTPTGVLSVVTGHLVDHSPNAAGRMVSVAQQALRERGVERPQNHIAVIRSDNLFADVMVKVEPFRPGEVELLASQAGRLGFTPLTLPGRAGHPVFDGLASTTGAERDALLSNLEYLVDATTDDSPFFFRFYRWTDLFRTDPITPDHTTALGQIILVLLLGSLSVLGAVLVLGPLMVFRRRGVAGGQPAAILLYFLAIGFGFMLFEISLMQRFVLFLGYPTYSLTVTLSSLLVFLGCGSFLSRRWVGHERTVLPLAVLAVALLALFYMKGLPAIQAQTLGAPLTIRVLLTVAMLAPLGLVLGMFFPLGIRRAAEIHEDLVPWAWAVNGCASVTATVLTVMLAMSFGFALVWTLSVAVYAIGVAIFLIAGRPVGPTQNQGTR